MCYANTSALGRVLGNGESGAATSLIEKYYVEGVNLISSYWTLALILDLIMYQDASMKRRLGSAEAIKS